MLYSLRTFPHVSSKKNNETLIRRITTFGGRCTGHNRHTKAFSDRVWNWVGSQKRVFLEKTTFKNADLGVLPYGGRAIIVYPPDPSWRPLMTGINNCSCSKSQCRLHSCLSGGPGGINNCTTPVAGAARPSYDWKPHACIKPLDDGRGSFCPVALFLYLGKRVARRRKKITSQVASQILSQVVSQVASQVVSRHNLKRTVNNIDIF